MPASNAPGAEVEGALDSLRRQALQRLGWVRLVGAAGFLSVALAVRAHAPDWNVYVGPLALYLAIASAALVSVRWAGARRFVALTVPLLDVTAVFGLQWQSLPLSPFPAGVAGWSLGLFAFLVVLSALSFDKYVVAATALTGSLGEAMLQRAAGVGVGAIVASGVVLALIAGITWWAGTRLIDLVERVVSEQTASRLEKERSTQLTRANEVIAHVNSQLLAAQREAQSLTQMLVHDMKGPLTGVLGMLDFLETHLPRELLDASVQETLAVAQRAGGRLERMISELLTIARLESGNSRIHRRRTSPGLIVKRLVSQHRASAVEKGVSLSCEVDESLSAELDDGLIERALENLLTNALSFTPTGRRIEMHAAREDENVVLSVRNDGPPVSAAVRPLLFQRYGGDNRSASNSGLGLYFCRLVAEAHGGYIALEEQPQWPVAFIMRLPHAGVAPH